MRSPLLQDAEGVVEAQHVGAQIPLALGLVQTFTGAIAKPLQAGDLDTTLPCLEKAWGAALKCRSSRTV